MRRLIPCAVIAAMILSGCDEDKGSSTVRPRSSSPRQEETAQQRVTAQNKQLMAYAPATDFSGAAPEDGAGKASAFFDGAKVRDAVSDSRFGVPAGSTMARGKRIAYTASSGERISDLRGASVPLPDDYDYAKSGATPGTAKDAGQTLIGFASFQLQQKFASVAPIMSRLGWRAAARRGSNSPQSPYRVTVHHTQGPRPMNEAETAQAVRNIQHYHMVGRGQEGKDNFDDIGYHFLIAGDGRVVEGRRAEYLGAHAGGANDGNIGIAMMGDFNKLKPNDAQIESLTRLVTFLSVKYKKDPAAKGFLEPHQHYSNTDCPGRNMMSILDSLRQKIDHENEQIMAGGTVGKTDEFTPLSVTDGNPSA